jgi:hypothetical protein
LPRRQQRRARSWLWLPKTQSGEDNKRRVNRRTSFQGYREVDLGVIQGCASRRFHFEDKAFHFEVRNQRVVLVVQVTLL